jgi:hypothetical protein
LEATARGLSVHQMAGIFPDKVREIYQVPEGYEPIVAIAFGYAGERKDLPQELAQRDIARRPRKPLKEIIFGGKWGTTADLVL